MSIAVATIGGPDRNTASTDIVVTKPTGTAVGDLLVAHVCRIDNDTNSRTWTAPAGWTEVIDTNANDDGVSSSSMALFWKVATSTETAASNFTFQTSSTADALAGAMYRITGHHATDPISASNSGFVNSDTTPEVSGITPDADCMIFLAVHHYNGGSTNKTTSGYAIVTSDPTWTEGYDNNSSGTNNLTIAGAYGLRAAATATGNATFTSSGDATVDSGLMLFAIRPPTDVTVSPSVIDTTGAVLTPTITGGATVSPSVINATGAVLTPTSIDQADWSNVDKSSDPTWVNIDKS